MSTSDLRDVLNIQDGAAGGRPTKKQRLSIPRPNLKGLAREVQNLGGDNPIAIVPEVTQFKKRRLASRKPAAQWELRQFRNSARDDGTLLLRHWRRKDVKEQLEVPESQGDPPEEKKEEDVESEKEADTEDSLFAKYNVQVSVPQYGEDQYQQTLQSDEWTKDETDHLMQVVKDFDLRWNIIWDRYEWNPPATNGELDDEGDESKAIVPTTRARSMEDLKARYYEVAAKMMAVQKPVQYMTQAEFSLHELMTHYNPKQEKQRKDFAITSLSRSRDEAREEESLLLEVKRILARSERFNEERRELYSRLDYPHAETDISNFKSSAGLQTLLGNLMNVDKSKKRKSLMGVEVSGSNAAAAAQAAAAEQARRESTATSTGRRDSISASTPTAGGKKGGQGSVPTERRKLTEQEEAIYGVSHHDRLGSGPNFRTEKINKLFTHKSNQQQLRMTNALTELDVPAKVAMPTAATTAQYELLLGAVNSLLDARKVMDKVDAEIKLEEAKKAEIGKALGLNGDSDEKDEAAGQGDASVEASSGNVAASEGGDKHVAEDAEETQAGDKSRLDRTADPRPMSRGTTRKRSVSVLSAMSDKSAKRQKK